VLGKGAQLRLGGARIGVASCPEDGTDPEGLLEQARRAAVPLKEF
jgi:hypothetical protein